MHVMRGAVRWSIGRISGATVSPTAMHAPQRQHFCIRPRYRPDRIADADHCSGRSLPGRADGAGDRGLACGDPKQLRQRLDPLARGLRLQRMATGHRHRFGVVQESTKRRDSDPATMLIDKRYGSETIRQGTCEGGASRGATRGTRPGSDVVVFRVLRSLSLPLSHLAGRNHPPDRPSSRRHAQLPPPPSTICKASYTLTAAYRPDLMVF